jgi:dTDP-4-amino-4,6-dideoxygalactose transaminase
VRERLGERGIETGLHYPRALTEHAAMGPWLRSPCPAAERAASEVLSLPMDPLMTVAEVERVTDELQAALR